VWHSVVVCDDAMNPVSGVYLWNFTGTDAICRRVRS
jgi:sugar (pentulose or hexulose) kinase